MQILDGKAACIRSVPPQQLGVYFADFEKQGKPLEVAVTIGMIRMLHSQHKFLGRFTSMSSV